MPHKKTTAELQELGQILYRRHEYSKALELFDEAIASEPNLTVSLLDNRAATYEKLGDLTSALKDAKRVIRMYEKDPAGYLRAGKLLQKASKPEIALGIYKHGIKKKANNADVLRKLHDKLLKATTPSTALDPFAQLPIELVEMILAHLGFRQIVFCTRVSKQWKNLISSLPNLWTTIDLTEAKRPVRNDFLSLCLNRSARRITTAHLKRLLGPEKAVTALVRHCKNLHSLSLLDGGNLSSDFVHLLNPAINLTSLRLGAEADINLAQLPLLLRDVKSLKHVEVGSVLITGGIVGWSRGHPNLESLSLTAKASNPALSFASLFLEQLLATTANLTSLTISGFRGLAGPHPRTFQNCPKLDTLDFKGCHFPRDWLYIPPLPPSVRVLRTPTSLGPPSRRVARPETHFLPILEELDISSPFTANVLLSNCAILDHLGDTAKALWMSDMQFNTNMNKDPNELSKLHTLSMKIGSSPTETLPMLLFSPRLTLLRHLRIVDSHDVDDHMAELIATFFADLRTLDLSSTAVTGYGVKKIVTSCEKLKLLKLNGCDRCGIDAVEWARSKGLRVEYTMNLGKK